jgi:hypothetical protein
VENRSALRELLNPEPIQWQYTRGVTDSSVIAPASYALDAALLACPGKDEFNSQPAVIRADLQRPEFLRSAWMEGHR